MREDPSGLANGLATGGKQFVMVRLNINYCCSHLVLESWIPLSQGYIEKETELNYVY